MPQDLLSPPLARMLLPECHLNALEPSARPATFAQLDLPFGDRALTSDRRLTADELGEYIDATLAAQAERGATLLLIPAHHSRGVGSPMRDNDVAMLHAARGVFDAQMFAFPAETDPRQVPRRLVGHVLAPLDVIVDDRGGALLDACASADVDAFLVGISRLHEHCGDQHLPAAAAWLGELQRRSGRPVMTQGSGELRLAFGLAGLAGACVRTDASPRLPWPSGPSRTPRVRQRRVLHPSLLAQVPADPPRDETVSVADRLFGERGCDCGAHDKHRPPERGSQTSRHTLVCRLRLWGDVTAGQPADRPGRFSAPLQSADRLDRRYGAMTAPARRWALLAVDAVGGVGRGRRTA